MPAHAPSAMKVQKVSPNARLRPICSKIKSFYSHSLPMQILPISCNRASIKQFNFFPNSMEALGCLMQYPMLIDLAQTTQKHSEDSRQPDHFQGEAIEPDDHFSPDMDIDLGSPDAMAQAGAYLGMDPNISGSDSEMDHGVLSGAGSGFVGSDSDSDDEAEAELHPALLLF
ncbi:hypothetical protein EDB92DRAFT_1821238 [Lactarius akahatsu]|uniref:Uncharacterized protein n=1 Tax=Lactarius akahatsu TaxID=416441 RepID=A0AAD4L932_9AGAM|nr:hypothetical protein EDB92DRAFT_1821238 [Lactarius akahatsu]